MVTTSLQVSHWRDSETLYRHTLAVTENNSPIQFNLGILLAGDGRDEEAVEQYREVVRIKPDHADAHFNLGNALRRLGRPEEAIEAYASVLKITPDDAEAHRMMGRSLAMIDRFDEALEHYQIALRLAPTDAAVHVELGTFLARLGRNEEAVGAYRQALMHEPDDLDARSMLAGALMRLGRLDEAAAESSKVLEVSPDSIVPMTIQAWILATHPVPQARDLPQAIQLAERAAELTERGDAMVLYVLARTYAAAERSEEATVTARAAVDLANANGQRDIAALAAGIVTADGALDHHVREDSPASAEDIF
jgi:tetratricopeptide (TPR) repeat protein